MSTVDQFAGTWQISTHNLIPNTFNNLLVEHFWDQLPSKISRGKLLADIPIEAINDYLNSWWQGPGSVSLIPQMIQQLRAQRTTNTSAPASMGEPPTIDDWDPHTAIDSNPRGTDTTEE